MLFQFVAVPFRVTRRLPVSKLPVVDDYDVDPFQLEPTLSSNLTIRCD